LNKKEVQVPETWVNALKKYSYRVNLAEYESARNFPNFFNRQINGDRDSTMLFEDYFRANIQKIEVWYEVTFWKLFSQKRWRDNRTTELVQRLCPESKVTTRKLIPTLKSFIDDPDKNSFDRLRKLFFKSSVIATTATFPAFFDPDNFPMVDTRIARWVNSQLHVHNAKNPHAPQLTRSQYSPDKATALTMTDFMFYIDWINWIRYMSDRLSKLTKTKWRARDVEMAVFTAWGDRGCFHPRLRLNAI